MFARLLFAGQWRERVALFTSAVVLGLVACGFATIADAAQKLFHAFADNWIYGPLLVTPIAFGSISWITRKYAPEAVGSGIPQVILRGRHMEQQAYEGLTSLKTGIFKLFFTALALGSGASVGREGPTVQISAAVMCTVHKILNVRVTNAVIIAGGAAGISAAFNTPIAGIAFAIEELASSYEQKIAMLVMVAVMTSGIVAIGVSGDYLYFGAIRQSLPLLTTLWIAPLAGVAGGLSGGLFSLGQQKFGSIAWAPLQRFRKQAFIWPAACGLIVACIGILSHGATWGTSYEVSRTLIEGGRETLWFGPAKFLASFASSQAGLPGGIFAASLATGAGLGNALAELVPADARSAVVILGMTAYFVGVVRAPLTAVLIVSEMTNSRSLILGLFLTAIIADGISAIFCPDKLYHAQSKALQQRMSEDL